MPARLSLDELERGLERVIDPGDRVVLLYSGVWTFGARLDIPKRELPERIVDAVLRVVGPARTLMLPAYTYAYARSRRYDPQAAIPETGVLPIELLRRQGTVRTASALNSYAVVGPDAANLATIRGETLWGTGSVMEWIERRNARICVLGLPWEKACSFFHRMEERALVPYRYFKRFPGVWVDRGRERPWTETMYVRTLFLPANYRWAIVPEALRAEGRIRSGSMALIESALAQDVTAAGLGLLANDPYALLRNAPMMREWVHGDKAAEIAALPLEERV